jgi:hypothetical protein
MLIKAGLAGFLVELHCFSQRLNALKPRLTVFLQTLDGPR